MAKSCQIIRIRATRRIEGIVNAYLGVRRKSIVQRYTTANLDASVYQIVRTRGIRRRYTTAYPGVDVTPYVATIGKQVTSAKMEVDIILDLEDSLLTKDLIGWKRSY